MNTGTAKGLTISDLVPPGVIWEYAGSTVPPGWLLCDGTAVNRAQYSNLFRAIGIQHGNGDGSTTFNLPNRKGRVAVGLDSGQTEFNVIGKADGYKDKTVAHTHSLQNHSHTRTPAGPSCGTSTIDAYGTWNGPTSHQGWQVETQDHAHQLTTASLGGNNGDGFQGYAAGDQHWAVQTTDRTGQNTANWGGACPTGANGGSQGHTHGLEDHNHGLPGHIHSWAHTHADTYSTPTPTNTTGDSSATATSGNLQPYITMTYIVKY